MKYERVDPLVKEVKPAAENPAQPMLSDFGLYKCSLCGKMVMGMRRKIKRRMSDVHRGVEVAWRKLN